VEVSAGPGNFTTVGNMFEYQAAAAADVVYPPTGVAAGAYTRSLLTSTEPFLSLRSPL
jgi:hypothetical protein